MCGRFTLTIDGKFYPRFGVKNIIEIKPRYNIAPGQYITVITRKDGINSLEQMKWGLVPFWSKDPKIGNRLINARAESVDEKPAFRNPFKSKRCIIPASGYYEWKKDGKLRTPYYIHKPGEFLSLAGVYDTWKDVEGHEMNTVTIITRPAEASVAQIHDRMPAAISKKDQGLWLDNTNFDIDSLKQVLLSNEGVFESYEISSAVNSPENDIRDLLMPVIRQKVERKDLFG